MKKRSIYQLKNDLSRINLDSKQTIKKKQETIAKQYEKQGKAMPKKLQEGRATVSDLKKYLNTLVGNVTDRIVRREKANEGYITRGIEQLNKIEAQRLKVLETKLQGYDKNVINALKNGGVVSLGRGIVVSLPKIEHYTIETLKDMAKQDGVTIQKALKFELQSTRANLRTLKNEYDTKNIALEIQRLVESEGFVLTDKQKNAILKALDKTDMLGRHLVTSTIYSKIQNSFYASYMNELKDNNNRELMDDILTDINRASHNRLIQYARPLNL